MKCNECRGCMKRVLVSGEIYFYCWLCKIVYKLKPGLRLQRLNVIYEEWIKELL